MHILRPMLRHHRPSQLLRRRSAVDDLAVVSEKLKIAAAGEERSAGAGGKGEFAALQGHRVRVALRELGQAGGGAEGTDDAAGALRVDEEEGLRREGGRVRAKSAVILHLHVFDCGVSQKGPCNLEFG
mmetsp:Transcript_25506/g.58841  ORF Transcript_25506/g.58841 Transcript_25506/m.58841 type:complete len:128 (-) Transcript_25506:208-591(-)